ncbi:MAG: hypothetical protein QXQ66_08815 [Candidatus Hadarchaeum sp.]|uniref:hypothetical protein n=1 Tax=Candidatus Hadarchaeum sp. TaxID=2883567 RepID=UPI0031702F2B
MVAGSTLTIICAVLIYSILRVFLRIGVVSGYFERVASPQEEIFVFGGGLRALRCRISHHALSFPWYAVCRQCIAARGVAAMGRDVAAGYEGAGANVRDAGSGVDR